jgi:hypothetical protein
MAEKENFLGRWSRLKHDAEKEKSVPQQTPPAERAPDLPPIDQLTPDSEYAGFMHPKVSDALRRAALKKLFADPRFNVPDPFEPYSGDWTAGEAIPPGMLAKLNQARTHLFSEEQKEKEEAQKAQAQNAAEEKPKEDEPGRKDA